MKHLHVVPYFLIIFFAVVMIITATVVYAAPPEVYLPITTSDQTLSATVFATGGVTTMGVDVISGRVHVSDSVHGTKNLRILESMLVNRVDGYNGHSVMLDHVNDEGIVDSSRLVLIDSDGTWTYFYDVDFSEVIIGGFQGYYAKTDYNLTSSDTQNLGQTFNGSNTDSLTVIVNDNNLMSKYDYINLTNPVLWAKLDDNYNDSSENNYIGTHYGTRFVNHKYNNGSLGNGTGGYVNYNYVMGNTTNFSIVANFKPTALPVSNAGISTNVGYNQPGDIHLYSSNDDMFFQIRFDDGVFKSINLGTQQIGVNNMFVGTYDGNTMRGYKNNILISEISHTSSITVTTNFVIFKFNNKYYNGSIDNVHVYNYSINQSIIDNIYYDQIQQLQINTTTNATLSAEYNSSSDNPISVPYGAGELFSALTFTLPDSVTQYTDGGEPVIIYDYPNTTRFDIIATVHRAYFENITLVSETSDNATGYYTLNINHTALQSGSGEISFTTTNTDLLNSDFQNIAGLTSSNGNATLMGSTLPDFTISTGYISSGTTYTYQIQVPYFYPPTNLASTSLENSINLTWTATPNADIYSIYQKNKSIFWTDEIITIDGLDTETSWADAQKFILPSPNFVNVDDYDDIAGLHDANNFYVFVNAIDDDANNIDDVSTLYGDFLNDGLTTDDRAWEVREDGHINRLRWSGSDWISAPGSAAVAAVTGAGTSTITAEFSIPISELGANFTNGSFMPMLWERECAALNPDIYTYHPNDNINNTDVSLWDHINIEAATSGHVFIANTTNLYYNVTGLDVFEWYNFGVSAWNGTQETSDDHVSGVTLDLAEFLVSGYILDADGNGIESAIVCARNGVVSGVEQTNASGYYERYLYADNYTLCANATGYHTNSISVSVTTNLTNQNITLSVYSNADLWAKLLEIEDKIDALSSDFTPTEGNYEMLSSTYNIFLLLLGACFILSFPKRGEVTERDTGLNNVLFSFIGTILSMFLAQIIVSGQVVESFEFASQIYDPLQHYLLYMVAIIMFIIFVLNILYYAKQRWE